MTRRSLIIGGSAGALFLVVAAIAVVVVLNTVNQQAAEAVRSQVEAAIAESPMNDFLSVGEIGVRAAHGRIDIADVVFQDGNTSFRVDTLTVLLPRNEALALSRNPDEATLTDAKIVVAGIDLRNRRGNTSFTFDELTVQIQGQVPTALFGDNPQEVLDNPENGIRSIAVDLRGFSFAFPEGAGSIDLKSSSFGAQGDLRFANLAEGGMAGGYASVLRQLKSISFELSDLGLVLTEAVREEMTAGIEGMVGPMPLLREPGILQIGSLRLASAVTDNTIEISEFSASSMLMDFAGTAFVSLAPDLQPIPPLNVTLSVSQYHEELRPLFSVLAQQVAMTELPDGSSFNFAVSIADMNSTPVITLE